MDLFNYPGVGTRRRKQASWRGWRPTTRRASDNKFREYKQPNELHRRGSFKFSFPLQRPTYRSEVEGENRGGEEEEARPAHDDRSCSAAIPSATRAFSMTCTKPSGARVSLWDTVWTNRGKFVGVIPNSWPMPDQIAFCVCLIPLRGPTLRIR